MNSCPVGWGRSADFLFPQESSPCVQNLVAIRILGSILAISSGIVVPIKARFTYLRATHSMPNKNQWYCQVLYGLLSTIYDAAYCVYGALKAVQPNLYILGDPLSHSHVGDILLFFISASFSLLMFAVGLNLTFFLLGVSKTMPRVSQERVRFAISLIYKVSWIYGFAGCIFSIFPFFSYAKLSLTPYFNNTYLLGTWIVGVFQAGQNCILLGLTIREIKNIISTAEKSGKYEDEGTTKIRGIMGTLSSQFRLTLVRATITQTIWIIFTLVPSLRIYFTYVFVLFYYGTYFTSLLALRSLWNFNSTEGPAGNNISVVKIKSLGDQHGSNTVAVSKVYIDAVATEATLTDTLEGGEVAIVKVENGIKE